MTQQSIEQVLNNAAIYIEKHGWTQGVSENSAGQVCTLGAIERVTYLPGKSTTLAYEEFEDAQNALEAYISRGAVDWNDSVRQNEEAVVATLRKVAEINHV